MHKTTEQCTVCFCVIAGMQMVAKQIACGCDQVHGPRHVAVHDQAILNCEVKLFATTADRNQLQVDRRSREMMRDLKDVFRSAVLTSTYPRSQIDIYITVKCYYNKTTHFQQQSD